MRQRDLGRRHAAVVADGCPVRDPLMDTFAGCHDGVMADPDALGDDHSTFIQFEGMPALSRAAIQLHAAGIAARRRKGLRRAIWERL